jgi:hypothetical protein
LDHSSAWQGVEESSTSTGRSRRNVPGFGLQQRARVLQRNAPRTQQPARLRASDVSIRIAGIFHVCRRHEAALWLLQQRALQLFQRRRQLLSQTAARTNKTKADVGPILDSHRYVVRQRRAMLDRLIRGPGAQMQPAEAHLRCFHLRHGAFKPPRY